MLATIPYIRDVDNILSDFTVDLQYSIKGSTTFTFFCHRGARIFTVQVCMGKKIKQHIDYFLLNLFHLLADETAVSISLSVSVRNY